ncbi:hypothetical protein FOA52_003512 [Chlamydomonas sp. UWO 241]|nr:hypothetical protein FOA52_003512 [Chlamydomonas sp. UWO 241]
MASQAAADQAAVSKAEQLLGAFASLQQVNVDLEGALTRSLAQSTTLRTEIEALRAQYGTAAASAATTPAEAGDASGCAAAARIAELEATVACMVLAATQAEQTKSWAAFQQRLALENELQRAEEECATLRAQALAVRTTAVQDASATCKAAARIAALEQRFSDAAASNACLLHSMAAMTIEPSAVAAETRVTAADANLEQLAWYNAELERGVAELAGKLGASRADAYAAEALAGARAADARASSDKLVEGLKGLMTRLRSERGHEQHSRIVTQTLQLEAKIYQMQCKANAMRTAHAAEKRALLVRCSQQISKEIVVRMDVEEDLVGTQAVLVASLEACNIARHNFQPPVAAAAAPGGLRSKPQRARQSVLSPPMSDDGSSSSFFDDDGNNDGAPAEARACHA